MNDITKELMEQYRDINDKLIKSIIDDKTIEGHMSVMCSMILMKTYDVVAKDIEFFKKEGDAK